MLGQDYICWCTAFCGFIPGYFGFPVTGYTRLFFGYCTGFLGVCTRYGFFWISKPISEFESSWIYSGNSWIYSGFFWIPATSLHDHAYGPFKTPYYLGVIPRALYQSPGLTGMVLNCRGKHGLPGSWAIKVCVAPEVSTDLSEACSLPQVLGIIKSEALKQSLGIQSPFSILTQKGHGRA